MSARPAAASPQFKSGFTAPSRRTFLKAVGSSVITALLSRLSVAAEAEASPPNILFLMMDDMGWTDAGFMGSKFYETPRIDGLAAEGMVFTNAYAAAPNCAPSRACLMTGMYTPRHGIYTVDATNRGDVRCQKLIPPTNKTALSPEDVTIAEMLKAAGFATGCVGKWHLGHGKGQDPAGQGFDFTACVADGVRSYFAPSGTSDDKEAPKGQYITDRIADRAIEFLQAKRDKPFFLYVSNFAVHSPWQAKPEIAAKYRGKNPEGGHKDPVYAAMLQSADENVGRILDALKRLDLEKNTVVVLFSDNGGVGKVTAMDPLRGTKGMLYEGGIREPAIIRWPGVIKPGVRCETPMIAVDFLPTFLELAGAPAPKGVTLDGRSFVPLLRGKPPAELAERPIFWHFPAYLPGANVTGAKDALMRGRPCGAVRKGPWKLVEFFEDGDLELYNLTEDIGEKNNLAAKTPDKVKELHQLLRDWRKATNAPVPDKKNPRYDPNAKPGKGTEKPE